MRRAQHLGRDAPHQPVLDHPHVLAGRNAGAVAQPEHVGVDGHRGLVEGDVEHDVGRLAAHPRQRLERRAVGRHGPGMPLDQQGGQGGHVLGLALP